VANSYKDLNQKYTKIRPKIKTKGLIVS